MTEEERAEARRAYRKAYYAKQREKLLATREIAKGLGCPERKRGRPRLSDEERLERRRERQRKYYERKVGRPVVHFTDEERKARERERYAKRQAKLGKTVTPRPKLTSEERLERRRKRQRAYQKMRTEYNAAKEANTPRSGGPNVGRTTRSQGVHKPNVVNSLPEGHFKSAEERKKRLRIRKIRRIVITAVIIFAVICIFAAYSGGNHNGYYNYKDNYYYNQHGSWYLYDKLTNGWITTERPSDDINDYYESSYYSSDYGIDDFSSSDYYEESSYSSSYYDDDDDDDSWSSSWDDDDDWDSGSDWDWDSGSDWDSDW